MKTYEALILTIKWLKTNDGEIGRVINSTVHTVKAEDSIKARAQVYNLITKMKAQANEDDLGFFFSRLKVFVRPGNRKNGYWRCCRIDSGVSHEL